MAPTRSIIVGFSILVLLFLGGCISRREMLMRHQAACQSFGFTPGTQPYANCLLQFEVADYGYGHHGRGLGALRTGQHFPLLPPPSPASPDEPPK